MKKKVFWSFLIIILISISYVIFTFAEYMYTQKSNEKMVAYCSQNDSDECYKRMFERLLPNLLIHNVKNDGKELSLAKVDKTPAWVPFLAYDNLYAFIRFFDFSLHFPIGHNFYEYKLRERHNFSTIEIAYWTDFDKADAISKQIQDLEEEEKKKYNETQKALFAKKKEQMDEDNKKKRQL